MKKGNSVRRTKKENWVRRKWEKTELKWKVRGNLFSTTTEKEDLVRTGSWDKDGGKGRRLEEIEGE